MKTGRKLKEISSENLEFIRNNYLKIHINDIVLKTGVSKWCVKRVIKDENLRQKSPNKHLNDEYIKAWYPHFGSKVVAKELNLTVSYVSYRATVLKLKKLSLDKRLCSSCRVNFCAYKRRSKCPKCCISDNKKSKIKKLNNNTKESKIKAIIRSGKDNCKKTGLAYEIDYNYVLSLLESQNYKCAYTGSEIKFYPYQDRKIIPKWDAMSIDRIDCEKGYVKGNVLICCYWANIAKNRFDAKDFINMCKMVANNFKDKDA